MFPSQDGSFGLYECYHEYINHVNAMSKEDKPNDGSFWLAPGAKFTVYKEGRPYSFKRNTALGKWYLLLDFHFDNGKKPSMNSLKLTGINFLIKSGLTIPQVMLRTGHTSQAIEKYIQDYQSFLDMQKTQYQVANYAS